MIKSRIIQIPVMALGLAMLSPTQAASEPQRWVDPHSGIEFASIAPGCFMMGSESAVRISVGQLPEGPRPNELPQHQVCVDGFWLGTHEVTQTQWQLVLGKAQQVGSDAQRPASHISPASARAFLDTINRQSAATGHRYRLPTEAEWEYACRAGTTNTADQFSEQQLNTLKQQAWFRQPRRDDAASRAVGEMRPNAWGLYDMLGNVWELTADSYQVDGYNLHADNNPRIDTNSDNQVIRGGGFNTHRFQVRCRARNYVPSNDGLPTVGLRLVRQP